MKKKLEKMFSGKMVAVLALACVILLLFLCRGTGISEQEAMVLAEEFLVANEMTAPGLVCPDEPQQKNSLQRIVKTNIYGKKAYSMDLVFGPGPMNGRLIFSCAVSEDGKEFFIYDQAAGVWNRVAVQNESSRTESTASMD